MDAAHKRYPVAIAATPSGTGYWITTSDGSIANYGSAGFYNSLPGMGVRVSDIVGIAAPFYGSMGGKPALRS